MTRWMASNLRLLLLAALLVEVSSDVSIDGAGVEEWAAAFGSELYELSLKYSGAEFIRQEYERRDDVHVERVNGIKVVQEMATKMENMLENKVLAVKKLRDKVEEAHEMYDYNPDIQFEYFNSNLVNTNTTGRNDRDLHLRKTFDLTPNEHFNDIPVNIINSTVQVAANVYNFGTEVLNGIAETEVLNEVFQENYERDPTLTWQYFGHNTGFFRNYPGIEWEPDSRGLDLYDCRKRGWYISSATSPKDVVILVDTSGSMTGSRHEVAKHTVNTIMSTLGDDDFFNVISFGDTTSFIRSCFNGTLVQANADNKNLIKQGLKQMPKPQKIADFELALVEAFELLESFQKKVRKFNNTGLGANCNQAIMLITDGAHETYEEVFDKYNEDRHVRVFTYLIGADIKDDPNVKWMSCNNKGYYTRIGAFADVEENASKYIHVLSRPMVIEQDHITVWTNVYMDTLGLQLMTTVSQPVFNKKESNREQGILLGVAGVDVPVKELLKLTPAYKLGVNGYPFAITNNGYILYHPDLRPRDENGELKPNYNSVDLAEVELSDIDEQEYERTSLELVQNKLRTAMVDRETGYMNMTVRMHSKDMKRLHFRLNHYYYTDLAGTPFSLGIVLSDRAAGDSQLIGLETFTVPSGNGSEGAVGDLCLLKEGLENLFNDTEAAVLANWIYCNLNNTEGMTMTRPQALEKYLRLAMENSGYLSAKCDPELINHVIFDAKVTQPIVSYWEGIYEAPSRTPPMLSNETLARQALYQALCDNETMPTEPQTTAVYANSTDFLITNPTDGWLSVQPTTSPSVNQTTSNATDIPMTLNLTSPAFFGVTQEEQMTTQKDDVVTTNAPEMTTNDGSLWDGVILSFVGTMGGLTRIFPNPYATQKSKFAEEFPNTIEEEYYQRAAETSTQKFIYSVPLQGQEDGYTADGSEYLVTASAPVLVTKDGKRSIAAAIGLQMLSDFLKDMFLETTTMHRQDCNSVAFDCELTCYNESVGCYLLDEHGYIVMSKEQQEIGMHFASLTEYARVFDRMLDTGVYVEIKQIDYQAMCQETVMHISAASHLLDPLISISTFLMGFTKQVILLLSQVGLYYSWEVSYAEGTVVTEEVISTPCDKEMTYYSANSDRLPQTSFIQKQCEDCKKSYSMDAVPHSNLILLIVDKDCTCDILRPKHLEPVKVEYNSSRWCQRLRTQVHRRRPEPCHSQHPLENSTDCGRGSWLCPSLPWILLMLLVKSILTYVSSRT
ncbi:voltage-dependent calcium channel subunit alpha-2/delta-3-like isoform X2 [Patiria miniata]|uniref:VWFA domain-containing protein n=1 Tax=Patiria miniata TaxID=46514 RepID=A0A914ADP8_PATMI|nr:voltage-dependent calcium channel subunit alpha-2/delta-3-like isoform X2 [Patiria miniata]